MCIMSASTAAIFLSHFTHSVFNLNWIRFGEIPKIAHIKCGLGDGKKKSMENQLVHIFNELNYFQRKFNFRFIFKKIQI